MQTKRKTKPAAREPVPAVTVLNFEPGYDPIPRGFTAHMYAPVQHRSHITSISAPLTEDLQTLLAQVHNSLTDMHRLKRQLREDSSYRSLCFGEELVSTDQNQADIEQASFTLSTFTSYHEGKPLTVMLTSFQSLGFPQSHLFEPLYTGVYSALASIAHENAMTTASRLLIRNGIRRVDNRGVDLKTPPDSWQPRIILPPHPNLSY